MAMLKCMEVDAEVDYNKMMEKLTLKRRSAQTIWCRLKKKYELRAGDRSRMPAPSGRDLQIILTVITCFIEVPQVGLPLYNPLGQGEWALSMCLLDFVLSRLRTQVSGSEESSRWGWMMIVVFRRVLKRCREQALAMYIQVRFLQKRCYAMLMQVEFLAENGLAQNDLEMSYFYGSLQNFAELQWTAAAA
ncbi:hypothetical protein CIB48_g10987 [Xylaria polymorpha]|nr:hypothetical protein CIB48_g10987 [Xylaria polymorpha]